MPKCSKDLALVGNLQELAITLYYKKEEAKEEFEPRTFKLAIKKPNRRTICTSLSSAGRKKNNHNRN
jgi:hypothetical protein